MFDVMNALTRWMKNRNVPLDGVQVVLVFPTREAQIQAATSLASDCRQVGGLVLEIGAKITECELQGVPLKLVDGSGVAQQIRAGGFAPKGAAPLQAGVQENSRFGQY